MKLERNQSLLFLILGSMFLYLHINLIGVGFVIYSIIKLKNYYSHPFRRVLNLIKKDSVEFGAIIPENEAIQKRLISVYLNFEKVIQSYPLVKEEVRGIIESFWLQVSYNVDQQTWDKSLYKLESLRILPNMDRASHLDLSLDKLRDSFKILEEARIESQ